MIPKVQGCLAALAAGVPLAQVIDGRSADALMTAVRHRTTGTRITGSQTERRG